MIIRTVSLAVGLFGAFLGAQLPELVQQYKQRLGGALDEVAAIVSRFDQDAASNSLKRNEALAELAKNPDDLVRRRGQDMVLNVSRLERLEASRHVLDNADPVSRLGSFFAYADRDLLTATVDDFRPALPTTNEGLLCGVLGFIIGWLIIRLPALPFRRWREMRQRQQV